MNLVQKLPIGLGLACAMMLSSCSKEDAQTPTPQVAGVNESSALKTADGLGVVTVFPSTFGTTGFDVYPKGWQRDAGFSQDLQALPTGTSSLSHLWGSNLLPWVKPLPAIQGIQDMNSVVTISASASAAISVSTKRSAAKAAIKNLKPGKKYTYTVYVASALRNIAQAPLVPAYARQVLIVTSPSSTSSIATYVDLEGKKAEWVKQTVTFEAIESEAAVVFSTFTPHEGEFSYANIFVDRNSIKEVK